MSDAAQATGINISELTKTFRVGRRPVGALQSADSTSCWPTQASCPCSEDVDHDISAWNDAIDIMLSGV